MDHFRSFFSCFSGSSKVASQGDNTPPTSSNVKAKSKERNTKKSPPIPMTYFPIGIRFSRL
ncbi:hypothetical protein ES319_D06G182700v1 [Gossypium barbadense]|uniref:Uncharacterized protein n=1 Tax=Gossypium barbadense TaxID=3634 RepID=A0A5J5R7A4_GOSBA|nr:hypothetical protein ES319_D06G182700v1 [Gossypium barbadense]